MENLKGISGKMIRIDGFGNWRDGEFLWLSHVIRS